jgi:hypothetical protein
VTNALFVLIAVIVASPTILLFDGPATHTLVTGTTAAGIAIVSGAMRSGETIFFLSFARPAALLAALPALWMLIQIVPLGLFPHPIWASAQATLGHPIFGSISIDAGSGVQALGRYLTVAGIGFWSAATAVDRQRAERILFALVAATALTSAIALAGRALAFGDFEKPGFAFAQAADCIVIGLVVTAAAIVRTWERYETRHANPGRSVRTLAGTFAACLAAFALCMASLLVLAPKSAFLAASCGIGSLAAVVLIRRLGLGRWGIAAICVAAGVAATVVAATNSEVATRDLSLALATPSSDAPASTARRILADAPILGTGAGTFAAIAPIYHDIDEPISFATAPTLTAAIAIELGRPVLFFLVLVAGGAVVLLLGAALRRGRDSFYAAAGAGTIIALLILAFTNAGLLGTPPAIIAAATLGLALAQCKSRAVPH